MPTHSLEATAPTGDAVLDYDRCNLLVYAELLDAADDGVDWQAGALAVLGIDPAEAPDLARICWDSHLTRARWITGAGLWVAIDAFGTLPRSFRNPA